MRGTPRFSPASAAVIFVERQPTMAKKISLELDYLPRLPKRKKVGIGCIGAGFIMADCHLVAYRNVGFHPVAIASARP